MMAGRTRAHCERLDPDGSFAVAHFLKGWKLSSDERQRLPPAVELESYFIQEPARVRTAFCLRNTAIVIGIDRRKDQRGNVHSWSEVDFQEEPIFRNRKACCLQVLIQTMCAGCRRER